MKKLFFLLILSLAFSSKAQTCTALYSYGANFETVHFFNQSVVANAHYYWNFGDGTGSNFKEPIHEFPANGHYLVTLYVNDTVSNCSNYYEQWINVTKYSAAPCMASISDSIFTFNSTNYCKIVDNSTNCNGYNVQYYSMGGTLLGTTFAIGTFPFNCISIASYYNSNAYSMAFKTLPWLYDKSKNYNGCSANFEFSILSENTASQAILFTAMNKNATSYTWYFTGFGNPIIRNTDTATVYYPLSSALTPYIVLYTTGSNGCKDSLAQTMYLRPKSVTYVGLKELNAQDINLKLFPNPTHDKIKLDFDQAKVKPDQLSICNTLGQTLLILKNPQPQQEIDLGNFTPGVYFFKVQNSSGQKMFKVLKE